MTLKLTGLQHLEYFPDIPLKTTIRSGLQHSEHKRLPFHPYGNNLYQNQSCQICQIVGRPSAIAFNYSQANCKPRTLYLM